MKLNIKYDIAPKGESMNTSKISPQVLSKEEINEIRKAFREVDEGKVIPGDKFKEFFCK